LRTAFAARGKLSGNFWRPSNGDESRRDAANVARLQHRAWDVSSPPRKPMPAPREKGRAVFVLAETFKGERKQTMYIRLGIATTVAAVCLAAAAYAQEPAAKAVSANVYSVARESVLQGKVVEYSAASSTGPIGAHVKLQTSSGIVDVHLGNAHLISSRHVTLNAGDAVTVTGESMPFGTGTVFAARVLQVAGTTITLRSKNGTTLVVTPRSEGGVQAPAGAR
jgi:hypothetical protein